MTAANRALVLSLRPRFAKAILDGSKTAELRRQRVGAPPGTRVILYASSPAMAVVGTARISAVESLTPDMAWRHYRHRLGLLRTEFDDYLAGSSVACILSMQGVQSLDAPLPLKQLHHTVRFRPPQSYRYLTSGDPSSLQELLNA
jgi:predicted transcriptional regulator